MMRAERTANGSDGNGRGSLRAPSTPSDAGVYLAELASAPTVERAVRSVREFLGMEVAFIGHIIRDSEILETVRGDASSFGLHEGDRLPLADTYCQRVLSGRLPNLIADVRADDRARSLALTQTADLGAFVSMPLRLSDGALYGMLCAASHHAQPGLGYRELQFLNVFARMVADLLERESLQQRLRDADVQTEAISVLVAADSSGDQDTAAYHQGRCACGDCGAHTTTGVGYKVAGCCPNCGSYDLVEVGGARSSA
ncbi:MAG: GAF domain-containing protein, partial [Actinomycetota bacterium]|nr:GAF domain-containing protein [Actinomycetota bacterium]